MAEGPTKSQLGLALGAAIAFSFAAIVEAAGALFSHRFGWQLASAVGFGGVALLWFLVYLVWRKRSAA